MKPVFCLIFCILFFASAFGLEVKKVGNLYYVLSDDYLAVSDSVVGIKMLAILKKFEVAPGYEKYVEQCLKNPEIAQKIDSTKSLMCVFGLIPKTYIETKYVFGLFSPTDSSLIISDAPEAAVAGKPKNSGMLFSAMVWSIISFLLFGLYKLNNKNKEIWAAWAVWTATAALVAGTFLAVGAALAVGATKTSWAAETAGVVGIVGTILTALVIWAAGAAGAVGKVLATIAAVTAFVAVLLLSLIFESWAMFAILSGLAITMYLLPIVLGWAWKKIRRQK